MHADIVACASASLVPSAVASCGSCGRYRSIDSGPNASSRPSTSIARSVLMQGGRAPLIRRAAARGAASSRVPRSRRPTPRRRGEAVEPVVAAGPDVQFGLPAGGPDPGGVVDGLIAERLGADLDVRRGGARSVARAGAVYGDTRSVNRSPCGDRGPGGVVVVAVPGADAVVLPSGHGLVAVVEHGAAQQLAGSRGPLRSRARRATAGEAAAGISARRRRCAPGRSRARRRARPSTPAPRSSPPPVPDRDAPGRGGTRPRRPRRRAARRGR
jgi:hypothetical protein